MKKIIAILLVLLVAITLFSCNEENNDSGNDVEEETTVVIPTVSFNTNGGSEVASYQTNVVSSAPSTQKENHVFDGWYLDSAFASPVAFPLEIESDTVLHAKWLKVYDKYNYEGFESVKGEIAKTDFEYIIINPKDFDISRLSTLGYNVEISVTYDVFYEKDYNVFMDLGYLGAPEYETYIKIGDEKVRSYSNVEATQETKTNNITYTVPASDIINYDIMFHYSTDNIQNIVYVGNVVVEYNFTK